MMQYRSFLSVFYFLFLVFIAHSSNAALPYSVNGQTLPSLAPMLKKATPAVVNISTHTFIRAQENPLLQDPFFRYFFGLPKSNQSPTKKRKNQSLGSGVIIDAKKGYVITNNHVIDKADEITVTLRDGRSFTAELLGTDPETDIALLKIPNKKLTDIPLADSSRLEVGDFVVAIGNPFGLGQTVTSGIVSALGRTGLGIEGYEDFIQTDASINPGNSGGALVNLAGELIGINTAILAPNGGNVGIGFAIPSNMADKIIHHLSRYGKVQRGNLGVSVQDLTPDLAAAFNMVGKQGAVILKVEPNSAADKAGLRTSDVIIAVNGESVKNSSDVRTHIGLLRVGDKISVTVVSKGRIRTFNTKISQAQLVLGESISPYLEGLSLNDSPEGVHISTVRQKSYTGRIGFKQGDVIIGLNRRVVRDIKELKMIMSRYRPPYALRVSRNNEVLSVWLK